MFFVVFTLILIGLMVGAVVFDVRHGGGMPVASLVLLSIIAIVSSGVYFYFSSPVCFDGGGPESYSGQPERVGNFIWNAPEWTRNGNRIIVCVSRYSEYIRLTSE